MATITYEEALQLLKEQIKDFEASAKNGRGGSGLLCG